MNIKCIASRVSLSFALIAIMAIGGNADATAKAGDKGASADGEGYLGGVSVYSMTESGLALQATVKGTKFWVDKALN